MLNVAAENIVTFTDGQYAVEIDKTNPVYQALVAVGYKSWVEDQRQLMEQLILANDWNVEEALKHMNEGATWARVYEVDRSTVEFAGQD